MHALKKTLYKKVFLTEAKLQCQCSWNTKEECILRVRQRKYILKKSLKAVKYIFCADIEPKKKVHILNGFSVTLSKGDSSKSKEMAKS